MPRPRLPRKINFSPEVTYFKPQGVPLRFLDIAELSLEEVEALRLKNIQNLDQNECAKKMNTSQSTFQRILSSAYQKIADALINGKAIQINKGENIMPNLDSLPADRQGTGPRGLGPMTGNGRGQRSNLEECECPKCGEKIPHTRGIPCSKIDCPKCETPMRGIFCR